MTVPLHVVPLHVSVPKTPPLPHSLMVARPTLSEADALIWMLLPVHTPLAGDVMATVGSVVSPVLDVDVVVDVGVVVVDVDVVVVDVDVEVDVVEVDAVPAPDV